MKEEGRKEREKGRARKDRVSELEKALAPMALCPAVQDVLWLLGLTATTLPC